MPNEEIEQGAARRVRKCSRLVALSLSVCAAAGCASDDAVSSAWEDRRGFTLETTDCSLEPETLARGTFRSLAVSAANLYTVSDDAVVRVSTSDGTIEPLSGALATPPYPMVADAEYLYGALFVRPFYTELWRMPLGGGGFDAESGGLLLGSARSAVALGVNTSHLVSLEARPSPSTLTRSVTRFDKHGGGSQLLATLTSVVTDAFALDEASAYVTRGAVDLAHGEIVKVPLAGGDPEVLLSAPSDTFRSLAAAAGEVTFASLTRVGRVLASGEDVTSSSDSAYLVFADGEFAYYFTWEPSCAAGSDLYRVPTSGGAPVALAHEPTAGCIRDAVADTDAIYWLTADGALLRKADKR